MLRLLLPACVSAVVGSCLVAGSAMAGDATTIRIEPRPFYGATVTLEAGVRVFRPLPPTKRVIINPNRTPLNLSQTDVDVDVDVKETRNIYHHGRQGRTSPYVVYGGFGTYGATRRYRRGGHGDGIRRSRSGMRASGGRGGH